MLIISQIRITDKNTKNIINIMDQLGKNILAKLIECILQSRVNVQKKQIRRFDEINKQLLHQRHKQQHDNNKNINEFLNSLLLSQKHSVKELLTKAKTNQIISIQFKLVSKIDQVQTVAQVWVLEFQQFREIGEFGEIDQAYSIISTIFEQLLLFLNRQPLFSQYQRNPSIKNSYKLDYQLHMHQNNNNNKNLTTSSSSVCCITNITHKHTKQRLCHAFIIKIQCYYLDVLPEGNNSSNVDALGNSMKSQSKNKNIGVSVNANASKGSKGSKDKEKDKGEMETADVQKSSHNQQNNRSRKHSIYQFYDKDLDFVFLSSDDQTFKKSPKGEVKEIDIANYIDDTDEFQLLIISKDQQFIDENKQNFNQLASAQKFYFKN